MATYKYTAISNSGVDVSGVVKARNQDEAVIQIKQSCSMVKSIKEVDEMPSILNRTIGSSKVKDKDLALVCEQFSIILKAGLPIMTTIQLVANQVDDKIMKKLLKEVEEEVKSGSSLADAFEEKGNHLPTTFIETIRAGEQSGKLDVSFERMTKYLNKKVEVNNKVITALTYPLFVILVAVAVIIVIMVFAVPSFTKSFAESGNPLPLPTKILISVSNFFVEWWWLLVLIILIIVTAFNIYKRTDNGHYSWDQIKLKLPILGKLNLMNAASEYSNTFSTLLSSGLPAVKALHTTGKAISNYYIGQDILTSCGDVESGNMLATALERNTELPELVIQITGIGEQSGSLEKNLSAIAEYYDREVVIQTNRAISLLEPIIICVLAVVVVAILLAVYMPMFSLYGSAF